MAAESSLKEKAIIVQGIARKLKGYKKVFFFVCPDNIFDAKDRQAIKLIGERHEAAIFFADSKLEAECDKTGMIANLESYKKIITGATSNTAKVLAIINHCLEILNKAEFFKVISDDENS